MKKLLSVLLIGLMLCFCGCTPSYIVPEDRFVAREIGIDESVGNPSKPATIYHFYKRYKKEIDIQTLALDLPDGIIAGYRYIDDDGYWIDTTPYNYMGVYFVYMFERFSDKQFMGDYLFDINLCYVWRKNAAYYTNPIPKTVTFTATFCYVGESEERTETHTLDLTKLWDGR